MAEKGGRTANTAQAADAAHAATTARAADLTAAQRDALRLDEQAVRMARGQGAIELAIGRTLLALFAGDRLLELGYSCRKDYAVERLGVPPRTVRAWTRLARGLETRPLLRRAVAAGLVSPRKASEVLAVAVGDDEGRWTAAAMRCTLAELRALLRGEGHDPPDAYQVESLVLAMTPPQQDRLDAAIALVQEQLGPAAPRWQCVEAISQEWLGSFGAWAPEEKDESDDAADRGMPGPAPPALDPALLAQLAAVDEAHRTIEEAEDLGHLDAASLQARVDRLMVAWRDFDATFGGLALQVERARAWEPLGYRSLDEYARERLGMSARTVKQRAWLERKMEPLPELRAALASGRITYTKALLIAHDATPHSVAARIEDAASTTWQQLERESTEKEDVQNRAAGVRRLWGPQDAARTIVDAILCARAWSDAVLGVRIDAGEALALLADYFVAVWGHQHAARPRAVSRQRRDVLARTRGICSVPGCSRPAAHIHHILFRSRGGTKDIWNETGVCTPHHLHAIHRGYLTVRGRAGELLVWEFGATAAQPLEVFLTKGGDDVRKAS